ASTGGAIWAVEQGFAGAVGVSNKTDFLRPTTGGVLIGEATPIHRGRTQQLWQINITREEDSKLVAQSQVRLHNVDNTEFEPPGSDR
ncbi:MAG: PaaI family thioesterase, partial [Acidimicrobiia bacterium]